MENEKWTSGKLPKGFPTECGRKLLNDVIQNLSDELYTKTQNGKSNEFWRFLVITLIQSGHNELQRRNNILVLKATVSGLIISLIAISLTILGLKTSSNWESEQIQILDEQKKIQQQILQEITSKTSL